MDNDYISQTALIMALTMVISSRRIKRNLTQFSTATFPMSRRCKIEKRLLY